MLQPFERFKSDYIEKLIRLRKIFLVTQTYTRAQDHFSNKKTDILITSYDDAGKAKIHYNAIKKDRYAAIIDLAEEEHLKKLKEMLQEDSLYRLFWSVVESADNLKRIIDKSYKEHMRRYIAKNTTWRISNDTTIKPDLQITFGELFIVLKYGNQSIRVKFEEIEKV